MDSTPTVQFKQYLQDLCRDHSTMSMSQDQPDRDIVVEGAEISLPTLTGIPLGLIVNELVTNAIKHAFPDGAGRVVLSVQQLADEIELIVSDDGVGMAENRPVQISEKRGSSYIAVFVRQLGGVVVPPEKKARGTTITIRFPRGLVLTELAERVVA